MNGQFFCETSDECVPCSGVVELRAENAALASFAEEAMTSRRNVAHLLAENADLTRRVEEASAARDGYYHEAATALEQAQALRAENAALAKLVGEMLSYDDGKERSYTDYESLMSRARDALALRAGQQKG